MSRPSTTPAAFSTNAGTRDAPAAGLAASGFFGGLPVPSNINNYLIGWAIDWARYLADLSPSSWRVACNEVQPQSAGTEIGINNDTGSERLRLITSGSVGAYAYLSAGADYTLHYNGLSGSWTHLIVISTGSPVDSAPLLWQRTGAAPNGDGVITSLPSTSNTHTWRQYLPAPDVSGSATYTITAVSAELYRADSNVTVEVSLVSYDGTGSGSRTVLCTLSTTGSWTVVLSGAISVSIPTTKANAIEVRIINADHSAHEAGWGKIALSINKSAVE